MHYSELQLEWSLCEKKIYAYIISILILVISFILGLFVFFIPFNDVIVFYVIILGIIFSTIYFIKAMLKLKITNIAIIILTMPSLYYSLTFIVMWMIIYCQ